MTLNGHVTSAKTPRNVTTTDTYSYSTTPIGELTQTQEGSLPATTFTYFEPGSLIKTSTGPLADGTTGTVSYTYTSADDLLTVTEPGNATSSTIVTTFGYTTDGSYTQSEIDGEPITATDNLGHVRHFRYDSQGRPSSMWTPSEIPRP